MRNFSLSGAGFAGLFLLLALVLSGCTSRETRVESGDRNQVLYLGNLTEPRSLDPQLTDNQQDFNIVLGLCEGLMSPDPVDSHPVPGVAKSWDRSKDGLVYTFHLRPTARWSNGDPVTAGDFVFSYHRMLSPNLAAEYAHMLYPIKNARAFNSGKIKDFSKVGVRALDEHTLQITLEHPVPYFISLLAHCSWYPVHPATILKFGKMDDPGTKWTRPGNYVGNGPFVLSKWIPNQVITLKPNPYYWNAKMVKLKAVNFYPIGSADTEERAFRSGQLHVTSTIPTSKIAVYRREHPDLLHLEPILATYFYRINVTRKPFNDVRVRRALAMAINREQLVKAVVQGGEPPAFSMVPPGLPGYKTQALFKENVSEARRLLAEAGYPGGKGFPSFQLLYNTNEGHKQIAEAIQDMWKRNLGINAVLFNQEAKVYEVTMKEMNYDVARFGWVGDYLDPSTFLDIMTSNNGNNQTGWSDPTYDALIHQASGTLDQKARFALLEKAEARLIDQMPIIPIYFYTRANLRRPEVKGWHHNLLDLHPLQNVYLENPNAGKKTKP